MTRKKNTNPITVTMPKNICLIPNNTQRTTISPKIVKRLHNFFSYLIFYSWSTTSSGSSQDISPKKYSHPKKTKMKTTEISHIMTKKYKTFLTPKIIEAQKKSNKQQIIIFFIIFFLFNIEILLQLFTKKSRAFKKKKKIRFLLQFYS